jgi:methionine sulfoxide reductase heme-binding subunit
MPTTGTVISVTGVIAMVLLTVTAVLGILVNRRVRLPGLPRFASLSVHRYASLLALAFLALHILTAVLVSYAGIGVAAALIPFTCAGDRLWIGIGAVASDLVVALVVTSLLRRHIGRRTWRALHWLAYACWPAAMAHSIGIGTGMRSGRLLDLALACMLAVLGAGAWRLAETVRGPRGSRRAPVIISRPPAAVPAQDQPSSLRLHVDPIGCTGHGLCAELLPELITLDQWGYPLLADDRVPAYLAGRARRAVTDCPALALRLAMAVTEPAASDLAATDLADTQPGRSGVQPTGG